MVADEKIARRFFIEFELLWMAVVASHASNDPTCEPITASLSCR